MAATPAAKTTTKRAVARISMPHAPKHQIGACGVPGSRSTSRP